MGFLLSKSKGLLQDCIGLKPNLVLSGEVMEVDKFIFLGGYISPDGFVSDEVYSCTQRFVLVFVSLWHLWR